MSFFKLEYEIDEMTAEDANFNEIFCPGNVWISSDKKEVMVTSGNITFHEGREFHHGYLTEKSDVDCALSAFEKGFNGYYKKNQRN